MVETGPVGRERAKFWIQAHFVGESSSMPDFYANLESVDRVIRMWTKRGASRIEILVKKQDGKFEFER